MAVGRKRKTLSTVIPPLMVTYSFSTVTTRIFESILIMIDLLFPFGGGRVVP